MTITITLPDGSTRELRAGRRPPASSPRPSAGGLAKAAVARQRSTARPGRPRPSARPRRHASRSSPPTSDDGREVLRHSTAHVLAQAVSDLWPGAKYAIGPAIEDGFYYDFELPGGAHFTDDDLERIEARMREIIRPDQPFVRDELDRDEGLDAVRRPAVQASRSSRRVEPAEDVAPRSATGDGIVGVPQPAATTAPTFVDLCRGPHVPSTGRLGAFKLMRVAGAYWRGDEKRPQLQRIYGTAWESKEALDEHLHRLEEAERARPPQARRRARPVLLPRRDRLRAGASSIRRAASSAG